MTTTTTSTISATETDANVAVTRRFATAFNERDFAALGEILSDSIVDGVTGILVDDRAELVNRLDQLLSDPVLRDQLGAKAQTRSAEFSWAQSGASMRTVLEAVQAGRFVSGVV